MHARTDPARRALCRLIVRPICCATFSTSRSHRKLDTYRRSISRRLDEKTLYAILHALQCIGEAVSRLPSATADLAPQIPWAKIRSMRNLIAHDYAGIDTTVVWQTVKYRLPELRTAAESMLQRL
ncbi:MAG: DUF86 domain-containing protein [Reyranella sp.]|nr:DUF86 domain-containing protein [Reyranella sp.]